MSTSNNFHPAIYGVDRSGKSRLLEELQNMQLLVPANPTFHHHMLTIRDYPYPIDRARIIYDEYQCMDAAPDTKQEINKRKMQALREIPGQNRRYGKWQK